MSIERVDGVISEKGLEATVSSDVAASSNSQIDHAVIKKLRRKIDFIILPTVAIMYTFK
jgi:hypothetical protein